MKLKTSKQLWIILILFILEAFVWAGHSHHRSSQEHSSGQRSECSLEEREKNFAAFMMNGN